MQKLEQLYEGKAKKVFRTDDPELYIVDYKDDATAFNGQKKGTIVGKGVVNNKMSNYLCSILEEKGIPTHFVEELNDRETLVKKVSIVPLEVIIRNISAGSFAKRYGVAEGIVFDEPTIEFSYKNDQLHDPLLNAYHARALGLATETEIETIKRYAFQINELLREFFLERKVKLVDFKMEYGRLADGTIVLADEINRATPKTQSALLEAMQEHTVTVMGVSRKMKEPFFVLATQNPIEQDGTYPLPEAQMDRFMFNLIVPNPGLDELMQIVDMTQKTMAEVADAACSGEQLLEMRATASQIPVANEVMRYAMTLCSATHADSECASEAAKKYVRLGASPRAGQALISAAKVRALMQGRYNVAYSDVNALALPVLRHRMKLNFEAIADRVPADDIVRMIVAEVSKRFDVDGTVASVDTKESTAEGKKKRGFGKKTS